MEIEGLISRVSGFQNKCLEFYNFMICKLLEVVNVAKTDTFGFEMAQKLLNMLQVF